MHLWALRKELVKIIIIRNYRKSLNVKDYPNTNEFSDGAIIELEMILMKYQ